MSSRKEQVKNPSNKLPSYLINVGLCLLGISLSLFIIIFQSVIKEEFNFYFHKPDPNMAVSLQGGPKIIVPHDKQFGIVIPRIGANARVVPNVDPFNEKEYQVALTRGVAHARGTVYPGAIGNVFLFSHSSVNFYEASRYNSVFYLLNKLKKDDAIYLFYKSEQFKYKVSEIKVVDAKEVQYLRGNGQDKTVTLMTCWPAGTTLKRLVVIATIAR